MSTTYAMALAASLLLPACVLDPKDVGGNALSGSTDESGGPAASESGAPAAPDEFPDEVAITWDNNVPQAITMASNGDAVAVLLGSETVSLSRFTAAGELWTIPFDGGFPLVIEGADDGRLIAGGYTGLFFDASVPTLWILDEAGAVVGEWSLGTGPGEVTAVATGGGAVWSNSRVATEESSPLGVGQIRRHGPDGAEEALYECPSICWGLTALPDGQALFVSTEHDQDGKVEVVVVQVALDGTAVQRTPIPWLGSPRLELFLLDDLGLVVADSNVPTMEVATFDSTRTLVAEFTAEIVDNRSTVAALEDAIVYANGGNGNEMVVTTRELDGTIRGIELRSFDGAARVEVNASAAAEDATVVIGAVVDEDPTMNYGFARYVAK